MDKRKIKGNIVRSVGCLGGGFEVSCDVCLTVFGVCRVESKEFSE